MVFKGKIQPPLPSVRKRMPTLGLVAVAHPLAARCLSLLAGCSRQGSDRQAGNLRYPRPTTRYYRRFDKSSNQQRHHARVKNLMPETVL